MKTKHLFMALAASAVFTACQNQDVISGPDAYADGQFVKLEKGFALLGSTEGEATTKGQWSATDEGVKFFWRPNFVTGTTYNYTPDEIGLAWTGVCLDETGAQTPGSLLAAADGRVFSNYKFSHFGWKIKDTEPKVDECNGGFEATTYKAVLGYEDSSSGNLTEAYDAKGNIVYTAPTAQVVDWPALAENTGDPIGSEGLFNTNNSTVYAGQYIVYAPFDPTNTSNYIVATSKDEFAISEFVTVDDDRAQTIDQFTNEIFKYGMTTITEGGTSTAQFATQNLNGYVGLKLQAAAASTTIKKVILFDESGANLLTQVGISSKGIVEGLSGTALYLSDAEVEKEYTKTITATIGSTGENLQVAADNKFSYVTIPVLPTEQAIAKLKIVLINGANKAFIVEKENIKVERNKYATNAWIEIKDVKFDANSPLIATDETSLSAAINTLTSTGGTVEMLGNITLTANLTLPTINDEDNVITIQGGKIIVPDAESDAITMTVGDYYTIKSEIEVLQSCCKDFGGELAVAGKATLAGIITIGDAEEVEDANHEAKLNFSDTKVSTLTGAINNYGIVTIKKESSAASHELQVKGGTINNNDALNIEATGDASYQDAKLFVETGALNNGAEGTMTINGILAVGNSATATNSGVVVDKISSQVTGNIYTLGVAPGQYISEVDNGGVRFEEALYYRPTTTVKFVGSNAVSYDITKLNDTKLRASIDTYLVEAGATVSFVQPSTATNATVAMENLVVKSDLEFTSGSGVGNAGKYITLDVENLTIEGAKMTVKDSQDNNKKVLDAADVTINVKDGGTPAIGTLEIGDFVYSEIGTMVVNKMEKSGTTYKSKVTFDFSSQTYITTNITINGEADILQATASNSTSVAGNVWLKAGATSVGEGNWLHGIPTPVAQ